MVAAVTGAAVWFAMRPIASSVQELRLDITTPPASYGDSVQIAVSPDGRRVVFVSSTEGHSQLWVRSLDAAAPQPLAGTDGATFPFWSPDSRSLGFFADSKLKRIDLAGGSVQNARRCQFECSGWRLEPRRRHLVCSECGEFDLSGVGRGWTGDDADAGGQTLRSRITARRSSCQMATISCITPGAPLKAVAYT